MKTVNNANGIKMEFGTIEVALVLPPVGASKKAAAQLKQTVVTTYPGVKSANSKTDALFDESEFGATGQSYTSTRTSLLTVPVGSTVEAVQAKVNAHSDAILQKYISSNVEDVMTDEQKQAISLGYQTLADFKAKLQIKDVNGNELVDKDGNIVILYQQHFFRKEYVADEDYRTVITLEEVAPSKRLTSLNSLVGAN